MTRTVLAFLARPQAASCRHNPCAERSALGQLRLSVPRSGRATFIGNAAGPGSQVTVDHFGGGGGVPPPGAPVVPGCGVGTSSLLTSTSWPFASSGGYQVLSVLTTTAVMSACGAT